jgi:hypothetical protein
MERQQSDMLQTGLAISVLPGAYLTRKTACHPAIFVPVIADE